MFSRFLLLFLLLTSYMNFASADLKDNSQSSQVIFKIKKNGKFYDLKTVGKLIRSASSQVNILAIDFGTIEIGDSFTVTGAMGPCCSSQSYGTPTISGSSDFAVSRNTCTSTLGMGQSCEFDITFTPTGGGLQNAVFSFPYTNIVNGIPVSSGVATQSLSGLSLENPEMCSVVQPNASIIDVSKQTLAEEIPIVGSEFYLHYSSGLAPEYFSKHQSLSSVSSRYSYNLEGWTNSLHHLYSGSQKRLFLGTGEVIPAKSIPQASGNILVIHPQGNEVYLFSSQGKHLETHSAFTGSLKYTFGYDSNDRLIAITDAFGNESTFTRSSSGLITSITAPHGQVTTISHTTSGLIASVANPLSETYLLTYKSGTQLLETFTKPGGQTSTFIYDVKGRLSKDIGPGGSQWELILGSGGDITKSTKMNRSTNYTSSKDSSGNFYRDEVLPTGEFNFYEEDANKNTLMFTPYDWTLRNVVDDERFGDAVKRTYDTTWNVKGNSRTTSYTQDVSYPTGVTPALFNFSMITSTTTVDGNTSTTVFDRSTNQRLSTSAEGVTEKATIDSYERPISIQLGADIPWTFEFDSSGKLETRKQGTHNIVTNTYDSQGNLQKTTNVRNEETTYSYDLAGRVTHQTRPDGKVITFRYDSNGNVVGVTPPTRPEHMFGFNSLELLSTYEPPALVGLTTKDTLYSYNLDKQLTNVLRPDGQSAAYTYNSTTGLLDQISIARGNYEYIYFDESDLIDYAESPDGIQSLFDYYGRIIKAEEQSRASDGYLFAKVSYQFDSSHHVISRTVRGHSSSSASTVNMVYNADEKLVQVGDLYLTYSYPSGRLDSTSIDNIVDQRTYDAYGDLENYIATYTPTSGPAQVLYSYTLTRDLGGRITGKTETVQGVTDVYVYTYDNVGRLTAVTKNSVPYSSYTYDDNGNRTSGASAGQTFTATYDNQDRLLQMNSSVFTYNANGDIIHTQWNSTQQSSYDFDALGNMISASISGDSLEYKYDVQNRWVQTIANGTTTTRQIYENDYRIAAQYDDVGNNLKQFFYATNINSPDYMIAAGVKYRLLKDHLGSPRLVVKVDDGSVAQRIDYTDLGRVVSNSNASLQPFGFAGGIIESYTKFIKFGARFYDPEIGRWTSKDPILFQGGDTNLYGYVANDPVNWIDPDGLKGVGVGTAVKRGIISGVAVGAAVGVATKSGHAAVMCGAVTAVGITAINLFEDYDPLKETIDKLTEDLGK